MSTKFRNSEEIQKAFKNLLSFKSEKEEIEHLAYMVMYRFLSEVQELAERKKMTRKELARQVGTSASYITQLFRGNKLLNLETVAKFEKIFNITFDIRAKSIADEKSNQLEIRNIEKFLIENDQEGGVWIWKNIKTQSKNLNYFPCKETIVNKTKQINRAA